MCKSKNCQNNSYNFCKLLLYLFDKNRKANPKDKKTDWFYNNKDFDREKDDRADTNNYRTL